MASNKNLPLIAGGIAALFLLMGGKAKASTPTKPAQESGDQIPPTDVPNGNIPKEEPTPKPNSGPGLSINVGPVTAIEMQNASIAVSYANEIAASGGEDLKQQPGQSSLDWLTNITFWFTYSIPDSWCPEDGQQFCTQFYGGESVPHKLDKNMKKINNKGFEYWSKVWVRIRNYIKGKYKEELGL